MDLLAILSDHLDFILRFYTNAAEPFETLKRKIEAEEEPFVPHHEPGDNDGYEYQDEWNEADAGLRVLGYCSLGLVQKALQDYLRAFIMREAGVTIEGLKLTLKQYEGQGWFKKYCLFLEAQTPFKWAASPIGFDRIEQINLCRNDVAHDPNIDSTRPSQSENHFRKYPVSRFSDEFQMATEDGMPEVPLWLSVTRKRLTEATKDVRDFCAFVEAQRTRW